MDSFRFSVMMMMIIIMSNNAVKMQRCFVCFVLFRCVCASFGGRYCQSKELGHGVAQVDEVYRLRDVITEACVDAFLLNVRHDVCR